MVYHVHTEMRQILGSYGYFMLKIRKYLYYLYIKLNRIYDDVEAETRKSQESFQIKYLVSCEALPHTSSFSLYFHKRNEEAIFSAQEYKNAK